MYLDRFWFEEMFRKILEKLECIDEKLQIRQQAVHPLDGDRLLDNQDLCQLFGVTKRTIARYRQKKLIRFYTIRGKVWYKASEVEEFLKKKGKL
jgi:hypothetical protein